MKAYWAKRKAAAAKLRAAKKPKTAKAGPGQKAAGSNSKNMPF